MTKFTNFVQEKKQSSNRILNLKGKLILRKAVAYQESGKLTLALQAATEAKTIKKDGREAHVIHKRIQVNHLLFVVYRFQESVD